MKRILFFVIIFCALKVNAQNYLIAFAGTGSSATVSTVKVEHLTAGTSLTLNGSDILQLNVITEVHSVDNGHSSGLKIYPNPMIGITILQISPPAAGDAIISVLDLSGKLIYKVPIYLYDYLQEFHLSGLKSGLYLISIKGSSFQYSGKLLCNNKEAGSISIEKIGNVQPISSRRVVAWKADG